MRIFLFILLVNVVGCARPCCLHGCQLQNWQRRQDDQQTAVEDHLYKDLGMEGWIE